MSIGNLEDLGLADLQQLHQIID